MRTVYYDIVGFDQRSPAKVGRDSQPHEGGAIIAGVYTGDCDQPIRVWFPGAVVTMKNRYNPYFESADAQVQGCKDFPAIRRAEWVLFIASWREFMKDEPSLLSAAPDALNCCGMVRQLDGWREIIAKYCGGVSPDPKPPPSDSAANVLKTVAITAAVVAGAVVIISFAPQLKALLPSK